MLKIFVITGTVDFPNLLVLHETSLMICQSLLVFTDFCSFLANQVLNLELRKGLMANFEIRFSHLSARVDRLLDFRISLYVVYLST